MRGLLRPLASAGAVGALLAAGVVAAPPAQAAGRITVVLRDGVLHVTGNDTANDIVVLRAADGRIVVRADSRVVRRGGTPTVLNVRRLRVSTYGGRDAVTIRQGLPAATILLGSGDDRAFGGDRADVLRGGTGNDLLNGEGGDDLVLGDAGNDYVSGNGGVNRVQGNAGHDWLRTDRGVLRGGTGDDLYALNPQTRSVTAVELPREGVDTLRIWTGFAAEGALPLTVTLASSATQQATPSLAIRLSAPDTFENLYGGDGADVLTGNALANRISGGGGDDLLTGGGGADAFAAGNDEGDEDPVEGEVPSYSFGHETLTDFGESDTVDLTPSGKVTGGIGTSTVSIDAWWDFGTMTATGHTFDIEDFS